MFEEWQKINKAVAGIHKISNSKKRSKQMRVKELGMQNDFFY